MADATLVLWDIDGTLCRGGGIGQRLLEAAFCEVLGLASADLGAIPYGGNTDRHIVHAGLELVGALDRAHERESILAAYLRLLALEVARVNPFRRLPGVRESVDALAERGLAQGLGTGNIEGAAWLKVEAIALRERFTFGGFGSDAGDRGDILAVGRARGAALLGHAPDACRVVVIGDTTRDIAAARAIGAEVIALASGGQSLETLRAASPDLALPSLAADDARAALVAFIAGDVPVSLVTAP